MFMNRNKQETGSNLGNRPLLDCRSFLANTALIAAVLTVGLLAQTVSADQPKQSNPRSDKALVREGTMQSIQF